ncbi:hypothetical protein P9139_18180 [Curtobacterium flaccumfaciens]|nr:hypothetical protein P9139_18180 [Curtobacterium flaccumfaciens]
MNTLFSRYATTLLPLGVAILGVLQAAQAAGKSTLFDWQTITQIVLLLVGTGVVYWLPLVASRWQGAFKTGAAIVFAIVSAVVAVAPDGHFTKANGILVVTAVFKALATELGVQIRVDSARVTTTPDTATVGLTSSDVKALDGLTVNGYAVDEQPTSVEPGADEAEQSGTVPEADEPKHLAKS